MFFFSYPKRNSPVTSAYMEEIKYQQKPNSLLEVLTFQSELLWKVRKTVEDILILSK